MSEQQRKILKINTSGISQQRSGSPSSAAPQSAISGTPKLKLTTKARFAETPTSASAATPKTATLKIKFPKKPDSDASSPSNKRARDAAEDGKTANSNKKKLKLNFGKKAIHVRGAGEEPQSATVSTPFVRFKVKEKHRKTKKVRPKGYAYDSEASDREDEPIQQWNFILRMPPGEDAEWVKSVIEKRELDQNSRLLRLRFLQEDGRRAMLTVRNKTYAAILVDLPCIIESMKGWDKKGWYKSADIHQMLLVLGTVMSEKEAENYPLPKGEVNDKTWAYAHGLTPPMHWVRKRRFRKRISTHAIQDIEESVKRLLEKDAQAGGDVQYDVLDRETLRRQEEEDQEDGFYDDDLAEGEYEDEFEQDGAGSEMAQEEDEEESFDAAAFEEQFTSILEVAEDPPETQEVVQTPASSSAAAFETQNGTDSEMGTPAAIGSKATSEDEDDDDDDDDEDDSDKEELVGFQRTREEITELESAIKEQMAEMDRVANPLLKMRIRNKIQSLQADLELKRAAVGDEDDEDEEEE